MTTKNVKDAGASLLPLVFLLLSPAAHAAVVYQVQTSYPSDSEGKPSETTEMSVNKPNLKIGIAGASAGDADSGDAIFRGDRREMVIVDHEDRTYMLIDSAAAERMGGQVKGAVQGLQAELDKLDPQQRAMVEQMMKKGIGGMALPGSEPPAKPTKEYRNTGERADKAGYPCVKYEVVEDGVVVQELWVTEWDNVKGAAEGRAVFEDMASFYAEIMDAFGESSGMGGSFMGGENALESFAKLDGFPVVTRDFYAGELESETVLQSVTERDLDPDAFEPPKGYRLRTMGPQ